MSIPPPWHRRRDYAGPALFSYGFRPFFLAAGLWAAFGILLWLPQYFGLLTLPTAFQPARLAHPRDALRLCCRQRSPASC